MRIEHIRVNNYKGFRDSGEIAIGEKFTVLVGQNNSGKTAVLDVLNTKEFKHKPYLTKNTSPEGYAFVPTPYSSATFGVSFTGAELKWELLRRGIAFELAFASQEIASLPRLVDGFFSRDNIALTARLEPGPQWQSTTSVHFPLTAAPDSRVRIAAAPDHQSFQIASFAGASEAIIPNFVGPIISDNLYVFRAERMNIGECTIEGKKELRSDAANLASVLLQLDRNPEALEQFTSYLRTIFPSIYNVVSSPKENTPTTARIDVINRDAQKQDWCPGVPIPLDDCGTGVSQVLAILYVIVTAETPKVIVIDEPNSFLHPGAAKKLLSILREQSHQYILTTHSPEIVRAVEPDMLHLTRWTGSESIVETLNGADVKDTGRLLKELGVRLSDVFGADDVLWVEGPTEEICFPLLLKTFGHSLSAATAVVSIVSPDDLAGKRARQSLAWEVYERLTTASALIPPALAFSFDREGRTPRDIEDLVRRSHGLAHFLPRRTYENFLLDAEAINAVLNYNKIETTKSGVETWINENGKHRRYFDDAVAAEAAKADEQVWLSTVHAPELLGDLFWSLSKEAPLEYNKTSHSIALTEWLLEHKRDLLKPLADYVVALLN